jgi:hypothetical protein
VSIDDWTRMQITKAEKALVAAQYEVDTFYMVAAKVDETSLLFRTVEEMAQFVRLAVGLGMEHFNSVSDYVLRLDAPGMARFHFAFLRWPGSDWRIECMALNGSAPLHDKRLAEVHHPTVIHASFKCADVPSYETMVQRLDGQFALAGGKRAEYRNTYGRFAYFGRDTGSWYLKPRVNMLLT